MNEKNKLTYDDIQSIIIYLVNGFNIPIEIKQLVKVLSKDLEIGSPDLLNGIIDVSLEQNLFYEYNEGVLYSEEALAYGELPNTFQRAFINYLPQFYKEACSYYEAYQYKYNLVYLPEFIDVHYHGLLDPEPGHAFMKRITNYMYEDQLTNQFWVEFNDYPYIDGMWKKLFDQQDSLIKLKGMDFNPYTNVATIQIFLIPSSNGQIGKATTQYKKFVKHIGEYLNCRIVTNTTIMKIYRQRGKKNVQTTR